MKYSRKTKEEKPVIAICYDFDKTLSPDDMQAQGYIQSVNYSVSDFWKESNELAERNDMDQNLAYMYKMKKEAEGNFVFNKKALEEYGESVELFPGVEDWFERICKYGDQEGVIIEHYVISSGLKEMIEGTSVAKKHVFERIYASSFYYNDRGVAEWPAQVVNYTNKTQFLFRIEKGVLDVNDPGINDYFEPDEIRVPFRNIIYIGDSDTDIPCMKLVNTYGGHSIGVYNSETVDKAKVYKMLNDNRIKYFAPADYTKDSELDKLVKKIIKRTATNEELESIHILNEREMIREYKGINEKSKKKMGLILSLEDSPSFSTTHTIINEMTECTDWTDDEVEYLCRIAIQNGQVGSIICDKDINLFYKKIIKESGNRGEYSMKVRDMLT